MRGVVQVKPQGEDLVMDENNGNTLYSKKSFFFQIERSERNTFTLRSKINITRTYINLLSFIKKGNASHQLDRNE